MHELWFWGFCGAFCYAAYVLVMRLKEDPTAWRLPCAEFAIALVLGPIFSRAFAPALAYYFPWMAKPDMVALSVMVGLCANPAAPLLSKVVVSRVIRKIASGDAST